jgi:hypothetical protein
MKKTLIIMCIAFFSYTASTAQSSYGITGGYYSYIEKVDTSELSLSENASGFFVGFFGEFELSNYLKLQAEAQFTSVYNNAQNLQQLVFPILLKYQVDDKFSVALGPQFDYILEDLPLAKEFGMGLAAGLFYDFTDKFYATFRYTFGITERVEDNVNDLSGGIGGAHVGIGFRF